MNFSFRLCLVAVLLCGFSSCAGYRLGGGKPPSLAGVDSISVQMFKNMTLHPRAEAIATSAIADALVQEGTYRLRSADSADAILEGEVSRVDYTTLRGSRLDTLVAEELTNTVQLVWRLVDANDPTRVLASGSNMANSSFFVDSNLQMARQNALPDAFERAATGVVSKLTIGY